MPELFIIAGSNGAGKTTASYAVLPELLNVKEFVNADEIARGLSPFQPEKVAIEAGRIMLRRIGDLMAKGVDFAFETTLATKSFTGTIERAKALGYTVRLVYFWLNSVELAIERVKLRVTEGGHYITEETIVRRYYAGLKNLLTLYKDRVDGWYLLDNSLKGLQIIAEQTEAGQPVIFQQELWQIILKFTDNV